MEYLVLGNVESGVQRACNPVRCNDFCAALCNSLCGALCSAACGIRCSGYCFSRICSPKSEPQSI